MMHNIEQLVLAEAMVRAAEKSVERAQQALDRNKGILRDETHKIIELIMPVFVVALGKFFAKKYFTPNLNTVCLTFNIPERKVSVDLVLVGQDGLEPTEYFTADDIASLNEEFSLLFNPKLKELEIALTFGGFLFPVEYLQQ
ncbi:MAG TPA: hypothetical protein VJ579_01500 [Candidatus Paceibacterota bacterium]|nr:hypothetical protein [Candidatus Paceibacterota bacterium]